MIITSITFMAKPGTLKSNAMTLISRMEMIFMMTMMMKENSTMEVI